MTPPQMQQHKDAHKHLLKTARRISPELFASLGERGSVALPKRPRNSLGIVLARAIVGQQISALVARRIWERIENLAKPGRIPIPLLFAQKGIARRLRKCGVSGKKAEFLIALGHAAEDGTLAPRRIRGMTHDDRTAYLSALPGIGPWTCDMVGIFYCRDPDIWPQGDLAVRRTFARLAGLNENKLRTVAAHFAPFRSYLALHMWALKNTGI